MCLTLVRDRLGKKCFATPWWTPEEHSFWWVNSQSLEQFGVPKWQFYHFPDFLYFESCTPGHEGVTNFAVYSH